MTVNILKREHSDNSKDDLKKATGEGVEGKSGRKNCQNIHCHLFLYLSFIVKFNISFEGFVKVNWMY